MISYLLNHLYFLLDIFILVAIWLPFYLLNKSNRKWILIMSIFGAGCGLPIITDTYLKDWWSPIYIYANPIFRIEDLIFGFVSVGVMSSIYLYFRNRNGKAKSSDNSLYYKIAVPVIIFSLYLVFFYVFKVSSLWTTIICALLVIGIGYAKKVSYIKYGLITGALVMISFLPMYILGLYLNPEFINNEWLLSNFSGIAFLGVPIEEFIWLMLVSIGIGAFIEVFD